MEAVALRLKCIALRRAIALRLEAIASRLEAIATRTIWGWANWRWGIWREISWQNLQVLGVVRIEGLLSLRVKMAQWVPTVCGSRYPAPGT